MMILLNFQCYLPYHAYYFYCCFVVILKYAIPALERAMDRYTYQMLTALVMSWISPNVHPQAGRMQIVLVEVMLGYSVVCINILIRVVYLCVYVIYSKGRCI